MATCYKKEKEPTIINGIEFETYQLDYSNPEYYKELNYWPLNKRSFKLNECYRQPSIIKQEIYNEWRMWSLGVDNLINFGVISYNVFKFTLYAMLTDDKGTPCGYVVITREHNRFYKW